MKREELMRLIKQIEKYDLAKEFHTTKEVDKWLSKLSKKQIQNINSLIIDPTEIMFPKELLINEKLLNCDDYVKRIEAMSTLKNGDGCWHLFDSLCYPNFLNSKNYYKDIELISKADTARYALWVVDEDSFINSKYHDEDLKLIIEAKDTCKNQNDSLVAESLATVASNIDSIRSPYHQKDMQLIATSGSNCLQLSHSYPEHSLNNLAINKVSLNDKYHLENMQILAKYPNINKILYNIMTDPNLIEDKNYRKYIESLTSAKSKLTAMAIYLYIMNPNDLGYLSPMRDRDNYLYDCGLTSEEISLINREESIKVSPNLKHISLLNQIDDKFVMFIESLITNKYLVNSEHLEDDINLLLSIKNKDKFMDLYSIMIKESFIHSPHHINDRTIIANTDNKEKRNLLCSVATNIDSINSKNHEYDMNYITRLDLDSIDDKCYKKICYYLLNPSGINHSEHVDRLEKLQRGEMFDIYDENAILEHLRNLEQNFSNNKSQVKVLSKIRNIFKNNIR